MKAHKAADLFPMMPDQELDALADDIKTNGLIHPIVLHQGRILDGRNRAEACKRAGVEPTTVDWSDPGCGEVAWVVSQNIRRRHLTPTQRSALAVELLPALEAEAQQRRVAAGQEHGRGQEKVVEKVPQPNKSRSVAADLVQVNERYVSDAKKIAAESPELLDQMRAGEITLRDAQREVKKVTQRKKSADKSQWTERELDLRKRIEGGEAVVVNLRNDSCLVAWAESTDKLMRVDRASEWGNPFVLGPDGDRETVCDSYANHYLPHKPSLTGKVQELNGKALGCWCSPERCHADTLAKAANRKK